VENEVTTTKTKAALTAGAGFAPARVLIVPDKFKGTLAAADACAAIARGWKSVRAWDQLELLPMSDGGDGFGAVMGQLLKARPRSSQTLDAAHRPIKASWWWAPDQKLAIIEAAQVIGLARLPAGKFHPFQLDTFGLGRVLEAAVRAGARHCLIGIGGSATNDAGFGLARALGWKFLDRTDRELEQWWQLDRLVRLIPPGNAGKLDITVAVDVLNPLLGPRGCSRVYGFQKGIRPEELPFIEKSLRRLTEVLEQQLSIAHARTPGAGAAGGLGFGLMAFAGAKVRSGFGEFAQAAHLEERIGSSDLVITAEGAVDRQTFMGKGVGQVTRLCRQLKIPCITLAGMVNPPAKADRSFSSVFALTQITNLERAKKQPGYYLEKLSAMVARNGFPPTTTNL
jgi:glycerate kinase